MTSALYSIAAVDPATGHIVELELAAESPRDAKERAEHCGLLFVVVRAGSAQPPRMRPDSALSPDAFTQPSDLTP